jgi:class 3 adenylate cyclase/tetratricopeptide (TPR) repeat protein
MTSEREQLRLGIAALEAQRGTLGHAVVDAMLGPVQARLAALEMEPAPSQTLKQVTILFLDVVGSTALSQGLDPEEIHAVMDGALARGSRIVESHHGKVLQYAGDNLLAVFGAEAVHEDDAEHAVRCGLALTELGRVLGSEVFATHGHRGFNVRVGIHTGPVLLGGGVDAEGSIRGTAVNIAARMEQTAPAGALRITHETYGLVRGLFEVEVQEPLPVKGVSEPVKSYLVVRAKPRSFRIGTRGIEGVATRMIGRDAELQVLQEAFDRLLSERKMGVVTVVGEAGVGKSRLLYEFESWAETRPEPFYIFRGRATPHTQGQPFGLLRDIVAWRFQIADDDTVPVARSKLEAGIIPLFVHDDGPDRAEAQAHLLGHLIGIEYRESRHVKGILNDPRQIRNRALHTAAQLFRRISVASEAPVVLQLDDLHWADNETLDFLRDLTELNGDFPMLLLVFGRRMLFERRPDWQSMGTSSQRMDLVALDRTNSGVLVGEILKKLPEIPAALRELVTGGSEGNPFYMEELVKMLIDQGAIQIGPEYWTVNPDRLLSTKVPATLTGILQARLDGLPDAEREALQEASVIGQVFWDRALVALDARAADTLPALVRRELTMPKGATAEDGLREYAFTHQLLHQVTYGTVLKRVKRELHSKLAHWLSDLRGLRANDFLGMTAEHYELAGDDANAAEYFARAAEHALTRFAHDAVQALVKRALILLDRRKAVAESGTFDERNDTLSDAHLRWRLLKVRERTLDIQGQRDEQSVALAALDTFARTLNDDGRRAYVALRRAGWALRTADWAAQETDAELGARLAEQTGDDEIRLNSIRLQAIALALLGDWRAGQARAQTALSLARDLGLVGEQADCLATLGVIAADMQGDPVASLAFHQQALILNRELGNLRAEAITLGNLGEAWVGLGEVQQAGRLMDQCLQIVRAIGDRSLESNTLSNLSSHALWEGDHDRALALAELACDLAVAVKAPDREVLALMQKGRAELALGRHAAAATTFLRASSVSKSVGSYMQDDALAGLAEVALSQGDVDLALRHLEDVLQRAEADSASEGGRPRRLELICYEVLRSAGDCRAQIWLERAHNNLQVTVASISEPALRQSFLNNIPHHRKIMAAWDASRSATADKSGGNPENSVPTKKDVA